MNLSTVFAVQTQGRGDVDQRTNSFRFEYSNDCVTFNSLINVNGDNHVSNIPFSWYITHLNNVQNTKKEAKTAKQITRC